MIEEIEKKKAGGEVNRFLTKQANEEDGYGQEALSVGAVGGGSALAARQLGKVTGMETRYHGTGAAQAAGIRQNGLSASKAGEGIATQRADLENKLGKDAIGGKTYLAKAKGDAKGYAASSGLVNAGVETGDTMGLLTGEGSIGDKIKQLRNAQKDATVLKAKIPYQDLKNGTLREVANPELRGLNKEDFIKHIREEMRNGNPFADIGMNPTQDSMINKQLSRGYDSLGEGTTTIQGDVDSKYFKGGVGHQRQNLRGVIDYARANPARFSKGLGGVGAGLGIAGAGAYGGYDEISQYLKEAEEVNIFLSKQANEDTTYMERRVNEARERGEEGPMSVPGAALGGAFLAGYPAAAIASSMNMSERMDPLQRAKNAVNFNGTKDAIIGTTVDYGRRLPIEEAHVRRMKGGILGGAGAVTAAGSVGMGYLANKYNDEVERQEEEKVAFSVVREDMEKIAAFFDGKKKKTRTE